MKIPNPNCRRQKRLRTLSLTWSRMGDKLEKIQIHVLSVEQRTRGNENYELKLSETETNSELKQCNQKRNVKENCWKVSRNENWLRHSTNQTESKKIAKLLEKYRGTQRQWTNGIKTDDKLEKIQIHVLSVNQRTQINEIYEPIIHVENSGVRRR